MALRNTLSILFFTLSFGLVAQPKISDFVPKSGPIGTLLKISGSGFDLVPENNIVFLGDFKAEVIEASESEITVEVPIGASSEPISITVDSLIALSSTSFNVTFQGGDFNQTMFSEPIQFDTENINQLTMGDFDRDGYVDIAFSNEDNIFVSVYRNSTSEPGAISFDERIDIYGPNFEPLTGIVSIDFNGDTKQDIISGNTQGDLFILTNESEEADIFFSTSRLDNGFIPGHELKYNDFNEDGKIDAIGNYVTDHSRGSSMIFLNVNDEDTEFFTPNAVGSTNCEKYLTTGAGNMNNHGLIDVVSGCRNGVIGISRNLSEAGVTNTAFRTGHEIFVTDTFEVSKIVVEDFNGDGLDDIAASYSNGKAIEVFQNITTRINEIDFESNYYLEIPGSPESLKTGDINGDGYPDLIVADTQRQQVILLQNSGDTSTISFTNPTNFVIADSPSSIIANDLDNDGKLDLIIGGKVWNQLTILRNNLISKDTDIMSFEFDDQLQETEFDFRKHEINIVLEKGRDVTKLIPEIKIPIYASISPEIGLSQDFSGPFIYTVTAEDGTTQDWTVNVSIPVKAENPQHYSLLIKPNPTKDVLTITGTDGKVATTLLNLSGQVVSTGNNKTLNLINLEKGTYILKVQTSNKVYTKKVIKN